MGLFINIGMKHLIIGLLILFCIGAKTQRAGWSYSSKVVFKLTEDAQVTLYHDPERSSPYEGAPEDAPIFDKDLESGKYMLTVEGYYHMDVK
jgi:hypothetical protein